MLTPLLCPGKGASNSGKEKHGSSSSVAKAVPISSLPYYKWGLSHQVGHSDRCAKYSLIQIVEELGLSYTDLEAEVTRENGGTKPHFISDQIAAKCMANICTQIDPNFEIEVNK